jgi:hypothetical protein
VPLAHTKPFCPKITSQLGGAWLEVLNADDADRVEKERMALAKAEAALDAKKSVEKVRGTSSGGKQVGCISSGKEGRWEPVSRYGIYYRVRGGRATQ